MLRNSTPSGKIQNMKIKSRFGFVLLLCILFLAVAPSALFAAKNAKIETAGPVKGWLIIVGGGRLTPEIKSKFVSLAGGADANFIVIPTAGSPTQIDPEKRQKAFEETFGVKHVTVLHTTDREKANSAEFVEPLRHASGVWIDGGRQWRLTDAYLDTAVEREIKALLARGGVVGGSSAGATIQGSYLVRGAPGDGKNPDGDNTIMMSPGHEMGFALLTNAAIDQHIITRHREADLDHVISAHPELLGIGIDESTATVVHGEQFEVIGASKVAIHDGKEHDGKAFYFLSPGQKFNLKTRSPM